METPLSHSTPTRNPRSLQALILAGLGLFLLQKLWSGTLFWYINQRFFVLTLLAAVGLLALAQTISGLRLKPNATPDQPEPHHHDDQPPPHFHTSTHPHSPWAMLIVALPVILGLLVPARPLGSSAIANKGLNAAAPLKAGGGSQPVRLEIAPAERTVLDWVRAFNYEANPAVFTGQPADVVAFVFHDSRLGPTQFFAARFAVSCCVADASGIGMIVEWPDSAGLVDNSWVRVKGPVQVTQLDGKPVPLIVANSVAEIPEPDQPFLYP